jgi:hypothetical protein
MTARAKFRCVVKEHASGAPFLVFEETGGKLFGTKMLRMDLHPDTTYERAQEMAKEIRRHMVSLSLF